MAGGKGRKNNSWGVKPQSPALERVLSQLERRTVSCTHAWTRAPARVLTAGCSANTAWQQETQRKKEEGPPM